MPPTTIPNYVQSALTEVQLLDDGNFHLWLRGMQMFFRGAGASYMISATIVPDEKKDLDEQLVFFIWSRISEPLRYLADVEDDEAASALQVWKGIKLHFQKSNMARRFKAREDLYNIEHDTSKSIDKYIGDIEAARKVLKGLGVTITDTEIADVMLMRLDPSHHGIRTSIITAASEPSLAEVKSILTSSSSPILVNNSPFAIKHESAEALAAYHRKSNGSGGASRVDDKGFRWCDPTNEGNCHRCGHGGHIAAKCIHDMPQHVKDWIMSGPGPGPKATAGLAHTNTKEHALSANTSRHLPRSASPRQHHHRSRHSSSSSIGSDMSAIFNGGDIKDLDQKTRDYILL